MSILVRDGLVELKSDRTSVDRRRMYSYRGNISGIRQYSSNLSESYYKPQTFHEKESNAIEDICYSCRQPRSHSGTGSCYSGFWSYDRLFPISSVENTERRDHKLRRDLVHRCDVTDRSDDSIPFKKSFKKSLRSNSTSSKDIYRPSVKKRYARQWRLPTGTTDDEFDENDEDSSAPDEADTTVFTVNDWCVDSRATRNSSLIQTQLSSSLLRYSEQDSAAGISHRLSESRSKENRFLGDEQMSKRRGEGKRRITRKPLKLSQLQTSRMYDNARESLRPSNSTKPDDASDLCPTAEWHSVTTSSSLYAQPPRQQKDESVDWNLQQNNSECDNTTSKTTEHHVNRLRRLFVLQLLFLLLFFLAVLGGMAIHRVKAVHVHNTLKVKLPPVYNPNHIVDLSKYMKLNLGNMLALDLLNNIDLQHPVLLENDQTKTSSKITGYINNILKTNIYNCEDRLLLESWLLGDETSLYKSLSTVYFSHSIMCFSRHPSEASDIIVHDTSNEKSCKILSLKSLQKAVNFIVTKHPITSQFVKSVYHEGKHLVIEPKADIFSVDDSNVIYGLLNATVLITLSTNNFKRKEYDTWMISDENNKNNDVHLNLAIERVLSHKVVWEVHKSKFGSSIIHQLSNNEKLSAIVDLFNKSHGILSPSYILHDTLYYLLTSAIVYPLLLMCWSHSFFSPQPVTLVHFPRLAILYTGITAYRIIVLYTTVGFIESKISNKYYGGDFSDTMVHYLSLGLLLTIEVLAAECSHPAVFIKNNPLRKTTQKNISPRISKQIRPSIQARLPLYFVYVYAAIFWFIVCYCSFYTAAFYHTRAEVILGCALGILGLYVPFWMIFLCGCVRMDQVGILHISTIRNSWS